MALEIVWTQQAAKGYAQIMEYLETQWTSKEMLAFEEEIKAFFNNLKTYPELLKASGKKRYYRRGPINKYTLLTYRIKPRKKRIELINIRGTRKKPLK